MINWDKKESPILSLLGMSGGIGSNLVGGGGGGASATGGDSEFQDGGYNYHVFTTTGPAPFVINSGPIDVQYLVVGGGGGTGASGGGGSGGGGGGGLLNSTVTLGP